jgi:hypothetical protein
LGVRRARGVLAGAIVDGRRRSVVGGVEVAGCVLLQAARRSPNTAVTRIAMALGRFVDGQGSTGARNARSHARSAAPSGSYGAQPSSRLGVPDTPSPLIPGDAHRPRHGWRCGSVRRGRHGLASDAPHA